VGKRDLAEEPAVVERHASSPFRASLSPGLRDGRCSRAASAGAISVGFAALEARINEDLFNATQDAHSGSSPKGRMLKLAMSLTPRDRLDAFAAAHDVVIDWGSEPYQSLDLVLSIRKHLLHHEANLYNAAEGHWPAKKLHDLRSVLRIPTAATVIPQVTLTTHS
jgi:hypothetical protein